MLQVEAHLFAQAAAGDEDALVGLLQTYGSQVRRRLSISATWQAVLDVDDVMQVTYLEAFLRVGQLQGRDEPTFVAWLTSIAQNNLRDAVSELEADRRPDPRMRVRSMSIDESYMGLAERVGTVSGTPSRIAGKSEIRQVLEDAIGHLPEPYQQAVRMCDLEQRPTAEAAATMGRSVGAVKMLRSRAHDCLRDMLGPRSMFLSSR